MSYPFKENNLSGIRRQKLYGPTLHISRARAVSIAFLLSALIGIFGPVAVPVQAQTPVEMAAVRAVQVIEDAPLVVGKATVVRVDMNSGAAIQVRVEIRFGQATRSYQTQLNPGRNTRHFPVDPPTAPGIIEMTAQVFVGEASSNKVSYFAEVVVLQRSGLKIFFLSVDWNAQDRARAWPRFYDGFAEANGAFFRAAYPFPADNVVMRTTGNIHMLSARDRAIVNSRGQLNWQAITAMYNSIAVAGRREMPDADIVVGVLPPGWFARMLNEPRTVGLELHAVKSVVSSQGDADYATLAHEIGHVMGRGDEYDLRANPPKIGNPVDVPGYWISKNQPIVAPGGGSYYSFMGAQDARSQYWVDSFTYMAILQTLQSGMELGR